MSLIHDPLIMSSLRRLAGIIRALLPNGKRPTAILFFFFCTNTGFSFRTKHIEEYKILSQMTQFIANIALDIIQTFVRYSLDRTFNKL